MAAGHGCYRCGKAVGELFTPGPPYPPEATIHRRPDDCITGVAAFDAQTRLLLTHGVGRMLLPAVPKRAGVRMLDLTCQARARHTLGAVYSVPEGWLLLAVVDTAGRNRPRVRQGAERFTTIRVVYSGATFLEDEDDWDIPGVMCPCGEVPITPTLRRELIDRARSVRETGSAPIRWTVLPM